ncbi:hypothetical protein A8709_02965 [Paenibacillus pectinilyticus]|uniref:Acid sugar phosphatase n=1 Tax=Paenibacillus pectinilyticus TaxID=512399 RepID=A0A1C1A766_9BACL|nr:HAD-IIA family hydrolase [Paenibacillus pectinilyticus]OCT16405.1 hypothetical protein A8709_02965 [Paenibacillus pectinilyticus]
MDEIFDDKVNTWFFDLDGCIYHGHKLTERANELLDLLRRRGCRIGFITNNSRENAEEIRAKLSAMGLQLDGENIVSATEAVAVWLNQRHGSLSVKVAGSQSLSQAIVNQGHQLLKWNDTQVADMVIIGRDIDFDYNRLQQIVNESRLGARIISTNADYYHPGEDGKVVPETGSLLAAIEVIMGSTIESIGKPNLCLYEMAMDTYGAKASECIMVGDNPVTDIAGAVSAGMRSVWIYGSHPLGHKVSKVSPTWKFETLSELYENVLAN